MHITPEEKHHIALINIILLLVYRDKHTSFRHAQHFHVPVKMAAHGKFIGCSIELEGFIRFIKYITVFIEIIHITDLPSYQNACTFSATFKSIPFRSSLFIAFLSVHNRFILYFDRFIISFHILMVYTLFTTELIHLA